MISGTLLELVNDVLDMSILDSGGERLESVPFDISELMDELVVTTQPIADKQGVLIKRRMEGSWWRVIGSRKHLRRICSKLGFNAVKFTPAGGSVTIGCRAISAGSGLMTLEFSCRDTGRGMSKEFQKHIFEEFTREESSTVSGIQGTGLGMSITKNIVDLMGGTIALTSEPGKGSEFIVTLCFTRSGQKAEPKQLPQLEGLRALVADDDTNTCLNVSTMLSKIGMRPEWTISGKEAVIRTKYAVEHGDEFSVYIIDWLIPDMNGIEVVRQIRKVIGKSCPIVILTAYDWSDIEVEAKAAGVTAFCSKPMFMSDLRETLMSALGPKRTDATQELLPEKEENFKGRTILLVEDNELNREIALEILREYGFQVDTAENGAVAVEKVRTSAPGRYDLVLMDVQMPVMDGYTATRQIRALEDPALAGIPILAMTANAFDEDRRNALASGMNGFLSKPIIVGDLVQELHKIL